MIGNPLKGNKYEFKIRINKMILYDKEKQKESQKGYK